MFEESKKKVLAGTVPSVPVYFFFRSKDLALNKCFKHLFLVKSRGVNCPLLNKRCIIFFFYTDPLCVLSISSIA